MHGFCSLHERGLLYCMPLTSTLTLHSGVGRLWKVGGGGGNISDYVLLVVPYSSRGVWGHAPQKFFLVFLCSETAFSTI